MNRPAIWQQWNIPLTFTSKTRCQSARVASSLAPITPIPALLIRMSTPPKRSPISTERKALVGAGEGTPRIVDHDLLQVRGGEPHLVEVLRQLVGDKGI